MSNYVTLLGAEDVQRAGQLIEAAADAMTRAASSMEHSAEHMSQALNNAVDRVEATAQDARDGKPTLRDYFAALSMSGIAERPGDEHCVGYIEQRARVAYKIADAMLAARRCS